MSKNIKISNIDSDKLLNGEMNEKGIKINDNNYNFFDSYDTSFNYVRAEIKVSENNELFNSNTNLNVTICQNGMIETVDELISLPENEYTERNIDNVFPFNEIKIVTREEDSDIDLEQNSNVCVGYGTTNLDFSLERKQGRPYDSELTNSLSYCGNELDGNEGSLNYYHTTIRNYVKIPKFYLRILFFKNKKDNYYYRRYEIISPEVYSTLNDRYKFGFFIPKPFKNKNYILISHCPESYGYTSCPFGSEYGAIDDSPGQSDPFLDNLLSTHKLMTSDVWFGIVTTLINIYVCNLNPNLLINSHFCNKEDFDGIDSIFSVYDVYHNGTSSINNNIITFDEYSLEPNLVLDLDDNIFVSINEPGTTSTENRFRYYVNRSGRSDYSVRGFTYSNSTVNVSVDQNYNDVYNLSFDLFTPNDNEKYFVTNIGFWSPSSYSTAGSTRLNVSIPITLKTIGVKIPFKFMFMGDFDGQAVKNSYVWITRNSFTGKLTINFRLDLHHTSYNLPVYFDDVYIQYVVFKETITGSQKKDIVKSVLLGNNITFFVQSYHEQITTPIQNGNRPFKINAQITDIYEDTTTNKLKIKCDNINISNYTYGTNYFVYDTMKIYNKLKKSAIDVSTDEDMYRVISLYRHPTRPIHGNYYYDTKRSNIDLLTKNKRIGNNFTILYFSNFVSPINYRVDSYITKYNALFEFETDLRPYMPFKGKTYLEYINSEYSDSSFREKNTNQGVYLDDITASVTRRTELSGYSPAKILDKIVIKQEYINEISLEDFNVSQSNLDTATFNSPYQLKKLFCDNINEMIPETYYDSYIENVFSYKSEVYFLRIPNSNTYSSTRYNSYTIQIEGCSNYIIQHPDVSFITTDYKVGATILQPSFEYYGSSLTGNTELCLNALTLTNNMQNIFLYKTSNN